MIPQLDKLILLFWKSSSPRCRDLLPILLIVGFLIILFVWTAGYMCFILLFYDEVITECHGQGFKVNLLDFEGNIVPFSRDECYIKCIWGNQHRVAKCIDAAIEHDSECLCVWSSSKPSVIKKS